jgi:hypothetical protein
VSVLLWWGAGGAGLSEVQQEVAWQWAGVWGGREGRPGRGLNPFVLAVCPEMVCPSMSTLLQKSQQLAAVPPHPLPPPPPTSTPLPLLTPGPQHSLLPAPGTTHRRPWNLPQQFPEWLTVNTVNPGSTFNPLYGYTVQTGVVLPPPAAPKPSPRPKAVPSPAKGGGDTLVTPASPNVVTSSPKPNGGTKLPGKEAGPVPVPTPAAAPAATPTGKPAAPPKNQPRPGSNARPGTTPAATNGKPNAPSNSAPATPTPTPSSSSSSRKAPVPAPTAAGPNGRVGGAKGPSPTPAITTTTSSGGGNGGGGSTAYPALKGTAMPPRTGSPATGGQRSSAAYRLAVKPKAPPATPPRSTPQKGAAAKTGGSPAAVKAPGAAGQGTGQRSSAAYRLPAKSAPNSRGLKSAAPISMTALRKAYHQAAKAKAWTRPSTKGGAKCPSKTLC